MFSICKSINFPMGHRLSKHLGKCKNLHGHNLKLEVKLSSATLNDDDMVLDFADISNMLKLIADRYDHALLLNATDTAYIEFAKKQNISHVVFESDPTSEKLCEDIAKLLLYLLAELEFCSAKLIYVRLYESDSSMAEYVLED